MMASRVVNQLAWAAREMGQIDVAVHQPSKDVRQLALELVAAVPGAWRPEPDEAEGALVVTIAVAGCPVIDWTVFHVPRPEGWVAPADDDEQEKAELAAGAALMAMATAELQALRHRPWNAAEAN